MMFFYFFYFKFPRVLYGYFLKLLELIKLLKLLTLFNFFSSPFLAPCYDLPCSYERPWNESSKIGLVFKTF